MDSGEAESLAIAETRGLVLLTDDADARRLAGKLGIRTSGTVGVLKVLWELRLLNVDEAEALLTKMKNAGYRAPPGDLRDYLR